MTRNSTAERLAARNHTTIFVTDSTPPTWSLERKNQTDFEFRVRRPDLDKVGRAIGSNALESASLNAVAMIKLAMKDQAQAAEAIEAWRVRNNKTTREIEEFVFDTEAFNNEWNTYLLRLAMQSPTLGEVDGLEGLADIAPVLLEAINSVFFPKEVSEPAPEVAAAFPASAIIGDPPLSDYLRTAAEFMVEKEIELTQ